MNPREFAGIIIGLPAEKQNEFFEILKSQLSEEEWFTVVKFVGLEKMYRSPARCNAMKKAIRDQLCEEFYGHAHEEPEKSFFDPCNPVYMTTIV